jgi:tetratricopeptide (TPR) repeat protein
MRWQVGLFLVAVPAVVLAQQPQNPYGTNPTGPAQQQYPYYPPPQQQYPYYPPPRTTPAPQPLPPPGPARLTLATRSMDVAQLVTSCANALDNYHLDVARKKCGEALAKEDSLAFTHYLLAQADAPDVANKELARATDLAKSASRGEQLFIEAYRAMFQARTADAKKAYDELVKTLPGDARALVARGQFKQTALNDLDGAVTDYTHAIELDAKYPAAYNFLAWAEADRGRLEEAQAALKKYVDMAPTEANAYDSLAHMALRRGATDEAVAQAKKALQVDPSFVVAHAVLGDALLFSGKGKEARRSYAALISTDDPQIHHDGAMREARSWLFDGRYGDGERALSAEADLSAKTKRPGDQADALVELARVQLDRNALAEAGQTLRVARTALEAPDNGAVLTEGQRRGLSSEAIHVRAMVLAAIGERGLAEQRADEMGVVLKMGGDAKAGQKATALKGWIAARNSDDKTAVGELAQATRPTLRLAWALALVRGGEEGKARAVFDELARRMVNDLEGALTKPRAGAWLKQHAGAEAQVQQ